MRRNIVVMAAFTVAVWVAAWMGFHNLAVFLVCVALMWGAAVAVCSLARDRSCLVCGQPYEVGVFGCHDACARETRLVR